MPGSSRTVWDGGRTWPQEPVVFFPGVCSALLQLLRTYTTKQAHSRVGGEVQIGESGLCSTHAGIWCSEGKLAPGPPLAPAQGPVLTDREALSTDASFPMHIPTPTSPWWTFSLQQACQRRVLISGEGLWWGASQPGDRLRGWGQGPIGGALQRGAARGTSFRSQDPRQRECC